MRNISRLFDDFFSHFIRIFIVRFSFFSILIAPYIYEFSSSMSKNKNTGFFTLRWFSVSLKFYIDILALCVCISYFIVQCWISLSDIKRFDYFLLSRLIVYVWRRIKHFSLKQWLNAFDRFPKQKPREQTIKISSIAHKLDKYLRRMKHFSYEFMIFLETKLIAFE